MINQKYTINKLLGKGRSAVYLCDDIYSPGKSIAIKILPNNVDNTEKELFNYEFFTLRKINHPNIVKALDTGTVSRTDETYKDIAPGSNFFTLEYFNGKNLLEFDGLNNEHLLKEVIKQLCSVLYYLHLSNYIYYDLKLENILISIIGGKPFIKLIDLGFAQRTFENTEIVIRGTPEYIAPEILKNEKHDFRTDFYSLGIALYRLIFKNFPFDTKDKLNIYKAHIEQEFDYPEINISKGIIDVIKKLLKKDPAERYTNAVQILRDLNIEIDEELFKDWMPAKVFAARKDCLTILKTYIFDKTSREVFTVRGSEGAGKTTLAYRLFSCLDNAILIENDNFTNGADFIKSFLNKIIYNNFVYSKLSPGLIEQIDKLYIELPVNLAGEIKSIINRLTTESSFVLILDAFNSYEEFTIELFRNIIPILQVNNIKVILTENPDRHNTSEYISNLRVLNLTPFTEAQLSEYLEMSFAPYFPKEQLKQLILSYADLMPGSLESFLKDLILLKIIKFTSAGIEIVTGKNTPALLKSSHEEIYNIRVNNLSENELYSARFISAFENSPGLNIIAKYLKYSDDEAYNLLDALSRKNILHNITSGSNPVFTSEGLKKFIYAGINDKINYHYTIAVFLSKNYPGYFRNELARQFELAGCYEESYKVLKDELINAEKISAHSFQKDILQHLLAFPLSEENRLNVEIEYCKALIKLNDYKTAVKLVNELIPGNVNEAASNELQILKANCLVGLGNLNEGKELLESLIASVSEPPKRITLFMDLANVNFNLNYYDETSKICNNLIKLGNAGNEILGSSYQLLGLISIYRDNDLDSALQFFEKTSSAYQKENLKFKHAGILMNIGNIYSMKGDDEHALAYWNQSLNLNQSIGNIQQEAKLLINFGIYYFNSLELEKSYDNYTKAYSIFNSLGLKDGQGLVESNLGEIYLLMCDYQKAIESLNDAIKIFRQIQNKEEELNAFFLLGKLYFTVGDYEKLDQLIKEFEFSMKEKQGETHKINYKYLLILSKIPNGDLSEILLSLITIRMNLPVEERKHDYFYCTMIIVDIMIKLNRLDEAAGELCSEIPVELSKSNNIFKAERNYMLGAICERNPLLGSLSSLDYYLNAYDLALNFHVTELTRKILYALFKIYNHRGNLSKSREYAKYCKALITFIAGNITDSRLRNIYLNEAERDKALKELNYFEEQF